jgi:hypothetical protein
MVFVISAAVESVASFYEERLPNDSGADEDSRLGLDFKLVSVVKLIVLAIPLVVQVHDREKRAIILRK